MSKKQQTASTVSRDEDGECCMCREDENADSSLVHILSRFGDHSILLDTNTVEMACGSACTARTGVAAKAVLCSMGYIVTDNDIGTLSDVDYDKRFAILRPAETARKHWVRSLGENKKGDDQESIDIINTACVFLRSLGNAGMYTWMLECTMMLIEEWTVSERIAAADETIDDAVAWVINNIDQRILAVLQAHAQNISISYTSVISRSDESEKQFRYADECGCGCPWMRICSKTGSSDIIVCPLSAIAGAGCWRYSRTPH